MKFSILKVADINILLKTEEPHLSLIIDANHEPFCVADEEKIDFTINLIKYVPIEFAELPEVFSSKIILNEEEFIWKAMQNSKMEYVLLFYLHSHEKPSFALQMSETNSWRLYTNVSTDQNKVNPLQYPLGTILLYYILLRNKGFILHGSGTFDGEKGRIFTGRSGRGKSTISQLWKDSGAMRIQDDRLIIRKIDGKYFMFNSPMLVPEKSMKAPVDEVFFIYHAPQNETEQIPASKGFQNLLPNCVQHHFNEAFIQSFISSINDFSGKVKFYDLGFVPDASVVDFIKKLK